MNSTILKFLLLTIVVLFNGYAYYANIPTEPLLKMHLALAIAILVMLLLKNNIVNLLLLWFPFAVFQNQMTASFFLVVPAISPLRILMILIAVIFMFEMLIQQRRVLSLSAVEIAMMFFSVYVIFSVIISAMIYDKTSELTINSYLSPFGIPFFIFFISKNILDDETKIKKFFFVLTVIGLYLGLTAIFEYLDFRPLIFPRNIISWQHGIRAIGPFLQPAVNGTVMGTLLFAPIFLLLHGNKRWEKYLYVISIGCLAIGILLTLTRSAWLASLAAIFIMPVVIPKVRIPFFISLLIITFLFLFFVNLHEIKTREFTSEREFIINKATLIEKIINRTMHKETVEGRLDLYRSAFRMFVKKPFFGYGYGAYLQAKKELGIEEQLLYGREQHFEAKQAKIHDTTVALLVDLGLIGAGLYFFIVAYILNVCRKLYVKLPRDIYLGKDLIAVCIGMFIVFLVSAQFYDMRFFPFPNSLFFCIAGILVGLNQRILRNEIKLSIGDTA